ncbi:hypothetical protein [Amaricoccus macauensis]|uniref:hypothetical protein n=1 Tax=Amaricoccus macauensis TaxID=57001 RepID=UPI003C7BB633
MTSVTKILALSAFAAGPCGTPVLVHAQGAGSNLAGVYHGFVVLNLPSGAVREGLMVAFEADGAVIFGAEEGHDEPIDAETGLVTANDFESTTMGAWRAEGEGLVFGVKQFRAGSALCGDIAPSSEGVLRSCSFTITARLEPGLSVQGEDCDLGGTGGGLSVQSVDGAQNVADPLGLGLAPDYCLKRLSLDDFLELAPLAE